MDRMDPQAAKESPSLLISGAAFGLKTCAESVLPWAALLGLVSPGLGPTSRDAAGMWAQPQEDSRAPHRAPGQTTGEAGPLAVARSGIHAPPGARERG